MKTSFQYKVLDAILDGYKAEEIAVELGCSAQEAAAVWFKEVYPTLEWTEGPLPKFRSFIADIEEDILLFYDFGADYYFITMRTAEPE